MPSLHVIPSGGLLTHQFIEAVQQPAFNHPALAPETFSLPGQPTPSPAELERTIGSAWELLVERWDGLENDLPGMDISTLRERWVRPFFSLLGFNLEYQRADLVIDELRFPISHMGVPAGLVGLRVPVHTVLPGGEDSLDTRRENGSGVKRLAPHDLMQKYLNLNHDARWGMVTDGLRLRLLRDYHHTYTRGCVEFDLQGIFSGRDFAAFRALYRLCHASRFVPLTILEIEVEAPPKGRRIADEEDELDEALGALDEGQTTPLESFYEHALATGVKVGDDLRENVRLAIETLANGFLQATPGLLPRLRRGELAADALYQDILHTIYRVLFLLFAEQRGMFPGRGSLYMEEYSLTALRAQAERAPHEDPHGDLWERLKTTFCMVEQGAPELGIFGYNGALFAADKTPILTPPPASPDGDLALRNDALLRAVRALTTVERDRVLQRISYADLSVEEIGSVYESLLDYTPRLALNPESVEGREIPANTFFLDPRGKERKTTGSYYTHPSLVNELIQTALLPVLDARLAAALGAIGARTGYDAEHPESLTDAQRQAAEAALLALKVIDPAAGSGAFLIAADNTLGLRLAQIRTGDLYPAEREVRRARRDVLARCIYAVDLNPMAVELCKLSLWINAVVEDQPLNFLDHHIKPGNSLVGALRRRVAQGIPSEAYGGATGDDKDLAKAAKKRNDQERAGQLHVFRVTELKSQADLKNWTELSRLAQEDPHRAERRYRELQAQREESADRLAFDLWAAAFFWPLQAEEDGRSGKERLQAGIQARQARRTPPPPTTQDVIQALAAPGLVSQAQAGLAHDLSREHVFFHWELEFPEAFPGGEGDGFDVVLGNPPWERIKLQEKEFFGVHDESVAGAPNAAARKKRIKALPQTNPALWRAYLTALRRSENTSNFLRSSGRYPLTGRGDINTYQVFAEHDRDLVAPGGRAGIIVPSGIATDYTNREFFAELVEQQRLASLYDFENRKGIFPGVHRSYKFCLLTITSPGGAQAAPAEHHQAEFAFFLLSTDDLSDPERRFRLTAQDFALINPNTRTCPIFRTRRDAELTRKLYRAAPVLVNETTGENPWGVSFLRMFDMANDSGLFRTREQLEDAGFHLAGNRFERGEEVWLPLYEGRMIHYFDHRAASVGVNESAAFRSGVTIESSITDHQNPQFFPQPRYWVNSNLMEDKIPSGYDKQYFIGFKDVTSATNERTAVFSLIPYYPVGHKVPLMLSSKDPSIMSVFLACVSTFTFDFVARQKVGGVSLGYFILKQLPVISVKQVSEGILIFVSTRILELTYTAYDLKKFADELWNKSDPMLHQFFIDQHKENCAVNMNDPYRDEAPASGITDSNMGFPRPPFKWDEARRAQLRADLDGLYAHLYGLTRDEFAYILDTFPIVRRKDEAKYGEYRTKRLCLEAYDRLVDSDLIPPEARLLQQESVIGERASAPALQAAAQPAPRPVQPPATVYPQPKASPAARPVEPKPPKPPLQAPPAVEPAEPKPQPKAQPPLGDFGLYRCQVCGKMVMGFDREKHCREDHEGKNVGYKQVR